MASVIDIENNLDIFNLSANQALLETVLNVPEVVINASKIEHCDYIGIQMLLSFIKAVSKQGHKVTMVDASPNFLSALGILGLQEEFNLVDKHHG